MSNDAQNIQHLDVNSIQPNPLQPRGAIMPNSLIDLVDSIKEHGILEPLVIAHTPVGFQIIAGERRWRAAKLAGEQKVPCIIRETTPKNMLEMAIVENVQREDLNALDRAKAFDRLQNEFGLDNSEIAQRVGKSGSYVTNTLRLLELPDVLKDGLLTGMITEGHARAIQSIKDRKSMVEAYKMILRESASVRRAEDIARRMRDKLEKAGLKEVEKSADHGSKNIVSDEVDKMVLNFENKLGASSKVKLVRTTKQTKLVITLKGNVNETEQILQEIFHGIVN